MARGIVRSLLACKGLDPDHLAATWAREATWKRGYGPGTLKVLARIAKGHEWRDGGPAHVLPGGSWGNGAAMRAAPLGLWLAGDAARLIDVTRTVSAITHAHPEGIDGGVLMALATAQALHGGLNLDALSLALTTDAFSARLACVPDLLAADPDPREVVAALGHTVRASASAVTAVYAAMRFFDEPLADLVAFCVAMGGDTDTIAAMAGGIHGARNGTARLPADRLARLEDRDVIEAEARGLARLAPA